MQFTHPNTASRAYNMNKLVLKFPTKFCPTSNLMNDSYFYEHLHTTISVLSIKQKNTDIKIQMSQLFHLIADFGIDP